MQFSRYDIDWIFISHIRGKIFFLLISLVKPVIITALPGWYGLASDLSIIYWLHPVSDRAHFPMPVFMFSRLASVVFFFLIWRPPALPHRLQCSTIGRLRLNRRVRDGNGCFPQAHRHQKFRVIQVSAQVWEKGCWKLASIRTFYQACICDAVATEELCSEVHLRTW